MTSKKTFPKRDRSPDNSEQRIEPQPAQLEKLYPRKKLPCFTTEEMTDIAARALARSFIKPKRKYQK